MDMYYSLVVRSNESLPIPPDRMFEETSEELASHFTKGGVPNLIALSQFPVILTKEFQEGDTSTRAVIGYMDDPSMNPHISRPVLRFPASALVDRGMISGRWAGSRTRWIVFKGDPYQLLAGVGMIGETAEETVEVKEQQVAVMMPFTDDASIDPVYKAIGRGVEAGGLRCVRVDQFVTPGDITEDIRRLIIESQTVIADLSGMNSNVMYELGFAHGRGKKTVLVSSDPLKDLPFDIRSQRVLSYQRNETGLDDLSRKIAEALGGTI